MTNKVRLDVYLAQSLKSRQKAQDLIKAKRVKVNNTIVTKCSYLIVESDSIHVDYDEGYVSRAAYKLKACFDTLSIRLDNEIVLDVGASTGGFTQICLEYGAKKVYALDVGRLQLDPELSKDPRVVKMEERNARYIEKTWFSDPIDFVCMDVSFISSKTILEPLFHQIQCSHCAILIKPQFECGPQFLNSNGVLKNNKIEQKILEDMKQWMFQYFNTISLIKSPIKGRSGNQETIIYATERRPG